MTATPPDPLATQHDGTPDPDDQGPVDSQTLRLREENRALRELLAAQVQASLPRHEPGWFKRLCWWLISAPGAALVGWRSLLGRDEAEPITRRRVGCATVTVLYTLAIYGALVLLVVSWNSPNTATSGATAASPLRVPLTPLSPEGDAAGKSAASILGDAQTEKPSESAPPSSEPPVAASSGLDRGPASPITTDTPPSTSAPAQPAPSAAPERVTAPASSAEPAPAAPQSTLRITEIPAPDPMAWVAVLDGELAQCAELGFFERPDCAWAARKQYCEPNQGWGKVKECPAQP
ncbi:hypothetical protein LMG26689_02811 [Achromobacter animicus]|uniref:hypothetical protein n=1 Tax=Achromobacter animicus TaxID=1389935 RepID=UPI0014694505|nr:hypothetical protein [Achromobacter animicus]CAB3867396.1 hypothetical protein LMG26689_02811 [Achromobacter animicus]